MSLLFRSRMTVQARYDQRQHVKMTVTMCERTARESVSEVTDQQAEAGVGSLAGQIAIVTGGGSGIGRGICQAFARAGAAVAVVDMDDARAREVVDEIRAAGGVALAVEADDSDPLAVEG